MFDQEKFKNIGINQAEQKEQNELNERRFVEWWSSLKRFERKFFCEASAEFGWNHSRKLLEQDHESNTVRLKHAESLIRRLSKIANFDTTTSEGVAWQNELDDFLNRKS